MSFTQKEALEILSRTPSILKSFLVGLSSHWIQANEGDNSWNTFDIVGHLIHGENTDWIPRLKLILSNETSKTFEPFDRFAQFKNSENKELSVLLDEFEKLRIQNLEYFSSLQLSEADYEKKGVHPDLGEVTLKQLLATWVTHDLGHIAQISRVMAKRYTKDVGPWYDYISILKDRI